MKPQAHIIFLTILVSYSCVTMPSVYHDKESDSLQLFSNSDKSSLDNNLDSMTNIKATISNLKQILEKQPNDVEQILSLANIYLATAQTKVARKYAKMALSVNFKDHRARFIIAQCEFREGKYKLAEVILSSLPKNFDGNPDVMNIKALIAYKTGRKADAWKIFNEATKRHPDHIALAMNYGVLLISYRQIDLAENQFKRVLQYMNKNKDANIHLAIIDIFKGRVGVAKNKISMLTGSENRLNAFNLGVVAYLNRNYNKAEHLLRDFISRDTASRKSIESASFLLEKIHTARQLSGRKIRRKKPERKYSKSPGPELRNIDIENLEEELIQ